MLWGLWQFNVNPQNEAVEVVPIRSPHFHLNALPFLEPPVLKLLTIEGGYISKDHFLEMDILITHPLTGLTEFTAFDVCGIIITNGALTEYGGGIVGSGWGDTRLINADGYSRWWNPKEFPNSPIFGYTDGLLGTPNSIAKFNCNVNPYKYFADDLGPDDNISTLPTTSRGSFSPGKTNKRHYSIELGWQKYTLNYAIDACWEFPTGAPPWTVPDSFPEKANRAEPYRIETTIVTNSLFCDDYTSNSGGAAKLIVNAYDWFHPELNKLTVRSTCGIQPVTASPTTTGDGYATYEILLNGSSLTHNGQVDLLIICESEETGYDGLLPGEPVSSYFTWPIKISDPTPDYGWAKTIGTLGEDYGYAVAIDKWGNLYITGSTDPSCKQHHDAFLVKYNSYGELVWTTYWGSYDPKLWDKDLGYDVAVDNSGFVYVLGTFRLTADFDPGPGVDKHKAVGDCDLFLCKFYEDGSLYWARTWGSKGSELARAVTTDGYGNIYVTGESQFSPNPMDYDPDPYAEYIAECGAFISKFDSTGDFKWVRVFEQEISIPYDVCTDKYGMVYITGCYGGDPDFDPGPKKEYHPSNGSMDIFASKFSSNGDYLGTRTIGGIGQDCGLNIVIDNSGIIYLSGTWCATVDFDPGPGSDWHFCDQTAAFVCKFGKFGILKWAATWEMNMPDPQYRPMLNLSIDGLGNVYCAGNFNGIVDFDPGPGECKRLSTYSGDGFVSKFAPDGSFLWVRTWGPVISTGLTLDAKGNLYLTGYFWGGDLDPGPGTYKPFCWPPDIYLIKLLPDGLW